MYIYPWTVRFTSRQAYKYFRYILAQTSTCLQVGRPTNIHAHISMDRMVYKSAGIQVCIVANTHLHVRKSAGQQIHTDIYPWTVWFRSRQVYSCISFIWAHTSTCLQVGRPADTHVHIFMDRMVYKSTGKQVFISCIWAHTSTCLQVGRSADSHVHISMDCTVYKSTGIQVF